MKAGFWAAARPSRTTARPGPLGQQHESARREAHEEDLGVRLVEPPQKGAAEQDERTGGAGPGLQHRGREHQQDQVDER